MTAGFELPTFGDDGFMPDRRGWWALPLTIAAWSFIFTIVYFATRNRAIEDGVATVGLDDQVAAQGYIAMLLITFIVVIFFVIPTATLVFGRSLDESTAHLSTWRAALIFGFVGLVGGAVPAVFIYAVNPAFGTLPFTQFLIPTPLAAFFSRLVIDRVLRHPVLRTFTMIATVLIVIGSLTIGVNVLTGAI